MCICSDLILQLGNWIQIDLPRQSGCDPKQTVDKFSEWQRVMTE